MNHPTQYGFLTVLASNMLIRRQSYKKFGVGHICLCQTLIPEVILGTESSLLQFFGPDFPISKRGNLRSVSLEAKFEVEIDVQVIFRILPLAEAHEEIRRTAQGGD